MHLYIQNQLEVPGQDDKVSFIYVVQIAIYRVMCLLSLNCGYIYISGVFTSDVIGIY